MTIGLLFTILTLAGIVFVGLSFAIIFLGKKVGDKGAGQQKITIWKYINLNTSSVITLFFISGLIAVAPIVAIVIKPDLVIKSYSQLQVYGVVIHENGTPVENGLIKTIRMTKFKMDTLSMVDFTGQQGNFSFTLPDVQPDEKYRFILFLKGSNIPLGSYKLNEYTINVKVKEGGEN